MHIARRFVVAMGLVAVTALPALANDDAIATPRACADHTTKSMAIDFTRHVTQHSETVKDTVLVASHDLITAFGANSTVHDAQGLDDRHGTLGVLTQSLLDVTQPYGNMPITDAFSNRVEGFYHVLYGWSCSTITTLVRENGVAKVKRELDMTP